MLKEKEIIEIIAGILTNSNHQVNGLFESDSEIINYGDKKLLINVDEFSKEDLFRDNDPLELGKKLAIGTLSDILASGGRPLFYLHSVVVDEMNWDKKYVTDLAKGIEEVLKISGTGFLGGDTGKSKDWRYTGIAIGEADSPLTRKGCSVNDSIYMTGTAGAGNLEATLLLFSEHHFIRKLSADFSNSFNLRFEESK